MSEHNKSNKMKAMWPHSAYIDGVRSQKETENDQTGRLYNIKNMFFPTPLATCVFIHFVRSANTMKEKSVTKLTHTCTHEHTQKLLLTYNVAFTSRFSILKLVSIL